MESWTIGAVRVTSLLETLQAVPPDAVIEAMTPEAFAPHLGWLQPDYLTEDHLIRIAIQSLLVESSGTRILEYEHWQHHEDFHIDLTDNVEPVIAAGLHRLVEPDHQVTPEVRLVPTPGHTPGHVSVRIESEGASALIGGDMVHHPAQVVEQHWASAPDYDPQTAVATRRRVLGGIANTDTLFIGTHFAAPAAGYVRGDDQQGWSWQPHR